MTWKEKMGRKQKDRIILSEQEKLLLQYICEQQTSEQIRKKLGKSIRTVENNRGKLIKKLGVKNTAGLVMYAIVNKLVKLDLSMKA